MIQGASWALLENRILDRERRHDGQPQPRVVQDLHARRHVRGAVDPHPGRQPRQQHLGRGHRRAADRADAGRRSPTPSTTRSACASASCRSHPTGSSRPCPKRAGGPSHEPLRARPGHERRPRPASSSPRSPAACSRPAASTSLDHLKEHLVEPPRVVDLKTHPRPRRDRRRGRRLAAHRRPRDAREGGRARGSAQDPPRPRPRLRRGRLAADPQRGDDRRQPAAAAALLVLPPRVVQVREEGRRHLLRRRRREPLPRPLRRRPRLPAAPVERGGAARRLRRDASSSTGRRARARCPPAEFFVLPAKDPTRENVLQPGEMLTEIRVPAATGWRSAYYEMRERAAFDWPLVVGGDRAQGRGRRRARRARRPRAGGDDPVALGAGREGPRRQAARRRERPRPRARPRSRAPSR